MEKADIKVFGKTEELLVFIQDFASTFTITDKEAEMLLGYLEGHDYVVGQENGKLYRGDLAEVRGQIVWEEYSMDELIDAVCEWNYELILDTDAERQNPTDMIAFANAQSRYESLKADEIILDKLFEQTKYHPEINKLAEQLADAFISQIREKGNIDEAVKSLADNIRKPESGGRVR